MYFIFRKTWSELSTNELHPVTQLVIKNVSQDQLSIVSETIRTISSSIRITHLDVDCTRISLLMALQLLPLLPDLDSLTIHLSYSPTIENESSSLEISENHLANLTIDFINDIDQVTFIIDFLPQIKCLALNCSNDINPAVLVQAILAKVISGRTPQLNSLCLWLGEVSDELLNNFHRTMSEMNIFSNSAIRRLGDRIYFQWD